MPIDSRRLPVPEESSDPHAIQKTKRRHTKLVQENGKRIDGRSPQQVRPIFLKAGVVSQAKGSAYIEMEQTKVICAVYGPREVTRRDEFSMKGQLSCELKFATFSCRRRRPHQSDAQDKDFSSILQEALEPAVQLEKFPKARMDVFVTVLQDDGSCLAAAMSCAAVALADAGVEMYDLVAGCSWRHQGAACVLDPTEAEEYTPQVGGEEGNDGAVTVGLMPSLHQVSALAQKGHMPCELVMQGMKECVEACQKIYPVLQQCLVKNVENKTRHPKT